MKPEQSPARNQTSPPCYTAAQIAAALGWTKRHAWKRLAPIPSPGKKVVRGNEADAWAPETIPADMHAKLVASARAHGMSFQEWIEGCSKPWEPRLALSEIAEPCLQDAAKLRDALLPALEIMDAPAISPQTLIARGLESYKRPFGQPISERQWRRLFDRTLRRDAGAKQFGRLELYLPENPDRKAAAAPAQAPQWDFSDLKTTIETFHVAGAPNRAELAGLWSEAFALYSAEADTEESRRALRKALIQFLWQNVPAIAPSQNAARVYFDRKWDKWKKAGCSGKALLDGRELKRGLARARQVPQEDMDRIVWEAAVKCRGRVRPAVRNLVEIGALSPATLELLPDDSCSKSYLNARIARPAKQEVEMIRPYVLGKKAIDDVTASIERDYSGLRSMSVVTGDDFTLNNYFYVPDGAGWYNLVRGQCLMFMDCRSLRILARSLQPEPNYCGLVIRTLQNDLTRKWGLPDCWYFERGIWQRSKLVKNAAPVHWSAALSAAETEVGWEAIEVRFVHATRARSKPAELIGGMLQNLLDGLPGYCGRDERRDMPEATKKALEAVRGQREHPSKFFFSFDQWLVELDKAMDRYNATPQEGRILNGLSPDEAFIKFWPRGGPTPWSPACWHLMAHWVSERIVKEDGISFKIGNRQFRYFNEQTGHDRGKRVLAWFDVGRPELLGVTDLNMLNPYVVERAGAAPFRPGDDSPELQVESARTAAHNAYPRARYRVLDAKFKPTFRVVITDRRTAELAQEFQSQRVKTEAVMNQKHNRAERVLREAQKLGVDRRLVRNPATEEAAEAMRLIGEAELEHEGHTENQD